MTKDDEKVDVADKVDEPVVDVDVATDAEVTADAADTVDAEAADSRRGCRRHGRRGRRRIRIGRVAADGPWQPPRITPSTAAYRTRRRHLLLSAGCRWLSRISTLHRTDQDVDQAVAAKVIQSAADGTVALLSYTPDTLDKDFANAKSRLTGDFLNYYTQFTQDIVTPAAKQKSGEDLGGRRAFGAVQARTDVGRSAVVHQPDDDQQGESRRLVHREQRQGGDDQGRRRLAHLVVRPGVSAPRHRTVGRTPKRADLVLSGGGVKGVGLVGAVVALMDAGYAAAARLRDVGRIDRRRRRRGGGPQSGKLTGADVKELALQLDYSKFTRSRRARTVPLLGPSLALVRGTGIYRGDYARDWVRDQLQSLGVRPSATSPSTTTSCHPNSVTAWWSPSPT